MMAAHARTVAPYRYKRSHIASRLTLTEIAILIAVALACLSALVELAQFMGVIR